MCLTTSNAADNKFKSQHWEEKAGTVQTASDLNKYDFKRCAVSAYW